MNILVIGGAGFIGHNVVRILEEQGHKCFIFDNFTTYDVLDYQDHKKLITERLSLVDAQVIKGNIEDYTRLEFAFDTARPEVVIHLASHPRAKIVNNNPFQARKTMIDGTENLLRLTNYYDVKRFVYISSSMVYGDFERGVCEDDDLKPGSIYATYKLAGEQLTELTAKTGNFEYAIVRPSAVYGPRDVEDRVVAKFFAKAINNGILNVNGANEYLDFTYVADVAHGIVLAATKEEAANQTYNMTYGFDETILNAAKTIIELVGKGDINIREKDADMPSRGYLNNAKAKQELGYCPTVNIFQGFKLYNEWLSH